MRCGPLKRCGGPRATRGRVVGPHCFTSTASIQQKLTTFWQLAIVLCLHVPILLSFRNRICCSQLYTNCCWAEIHNLVCDSIGTSCLQLKNLWSDNRHALVHYYTLQKWSEAQYEKRLQEHRPGVGDLLELPDQSTVKKATRPDEARFPKRDCFSFCMNLTRSLLNARTVGTLDA